MNMVTLFTYAPFAVFALTMFVFVVPLRLSTRAQAIWAMVLLLAFAKFLCFAAFGGHAFSPDLPEVVIWVWDAFYSGAMILFALSVPLCFVRFKGKAVLLPAVAWGLAAWGLYNGVCVPDVREVELWYADLPAALDGYRIVQVADLHCSSAARKWRTQAVVDCANALQPDLICLTGDNADGSIGRIARHLRPIRELRAKDGVLACTGNHEYYRDAYSWRTEFYSLTPNIRFLTNECAFPRPELAVGGVPDQAGWERDGLDVRPDPTAAFEAATNGEFRILLQHRPKRAAANVRELGVGLQLSGHTHGGIAPVFRRLIARFNGGFTRGLYPIGKGYLYVSPGCGQWAGFPMRFFNPSEITLVTLRRGTVEECPRNVL